MRDIKDWKSILNYQTKTLEELKNLIQEKKMDLINNLLLLQDIIIEDKFFKSNAYNNTTLSEIISKAKDFLNIIIPISVIATKNGGLYKDTVLNKVTNKVILNGNSLIKAFADNNGHDKIFDVMYDIQIDCLATGTENLSFCEKLMYDIKRLNNFNYKFFDSTSAKEYKKILKKMSTISKEIRDINYQIKYISEEISRKQKIEVHRLLP